MKFLLIVVSAVLVTTGLVSAQSNPSWWKYVPPESASVVGMQWKELQGSVFGPVLAADFAPGGSLQFPDIALLRNPEQILLSSPVALAIEYGTFPIEKLRAQAEAQGLKRVAFRPAELYVSSNANVQSVAYINDKLLLVGNRKVLEESITRIAGTRERGYSPLLARAARYSKEDLWIVASRLPDPLASRFLPLEIEASAFEGSVSVWDGLHLVAAVEKSSPMKALDFADMLAEGLADRPAMAEATEITSRDRSVLIRMELNEEELASNLKLPAALVTTTDPHESAAVEAPAKPQPRAFAAPARAQAPAKAVTAAAVAGDVPEMAIVVPAMLGAPLAVLPPAPAKTIPAKTIKIMGLESGPREIPLTR